MTVVITWIVACIAIISVGVFAGRGMKGEGQWLKGGAAGFFLLLFLVLFCKV